MATRLPDHPSSPSIFPLDRPTPQAPDLGIFNARWFASSMAVGGIALAIGNFPYAQHTFKAIAVFFWLGDVLLFITLCVGFFYYRVWLGKGKDDPREPLYYGCGSTALCSIATATALLGDRIGSAEVSLKAALVLFWVAATVSVLQAIGVCIYLVERKLHSHPPIDFAPAHLLIFSGVIVSTATGSVVALKLDSDNHLYSIVSIMFTCVALLAISIPVQIGMVMAVGGRLITGVEDLDFSMFWMLQGPSAVAGNTAINLGSKFFGLRETYLLNQRALLGSLAHISGGVGLLTAFLMWSFSMWMFVCTWYIVVRRKTLKPVEVDYRFWAFIFSNCVFAILTTNLWLFTGFEFFRVFGATLQAVCVLLFSCVCFLLIISLVRKDLTL